MLQKILKVGNSLALTLPSEYVKKLKLKPGDVMRTHFDGNSKFFVAKPAKSVDSYDAALEFKQWAEKFLQEYKPLFKRLAKL